MGGYKLVLDVQKLSKQYAKVLAAREVEFSIDTGEIFALIGPNGAGKTTTIRMLATLIKPTNGDALVNGYSILKQPDKVRQSITYLPDEAGAYKNMTGNAYLKFMASLFSTDPAISNAYVERAAKVSKLGDRLNDKIITYSRGMARKLLLARAVMTEPKLAILDEPTSGLDVINALEIRKMIKALATDGMSFLISSHNMLEIEFVSDKVGIMAGGRLLAVGKSSELKEQHNASNLEEVFEQVVASSNATQSEASGGEVQ
jgi:ABC-2 type transport system ATP-binding protein